MLSRGVCDEFNRGCGFALRRSRAGGVRSLRLGKNHLLEAAIPRLVERGLAVAVVKHGAHGYAVDRAGKDSERLFRAIARELTYHD